MLLFDWGYVDRRAANQLWAALDWLSFCGLRNADFGWTRLRCHLCSFLKGSGSQTCRPSFRCADPGRLTFNLRTYRRHSGLWEGFPPSFPHPAAPQSPGLRFLLGVPSPRGTYCHHPWPLIHAVSSLRWRDAQGKRVGRPGTLLRLPHLIPSFAYCLIPADERWTNWGFWHGCNHLGPYSPVMGPWWAEWWGWLVLAADLLFPLARYFAATQGEITGGGGVVADQICSKSDAAVYLWYRGAFCGRLPWRHSTVRKKLRFFM